MMRDPKRAARAARRVLHVLAVVIAAAGCTAGPVPAQELNGRTFTSQHHGYRAVEVVNGLEHAWSVAFLPGGDMLVTERPGRLRIIRNGQLLPDPVAGVPEVRARGQGGLLDVVPHPDFASNRLVYLSFSKPGPDGATTAVVRGRFVDDRLTDVQEVLEAKAWSNAGQHFGSRIVFDGNGYMFVSVGDRGAMREAQSLANHQGGVLRLHDDGRVPADNPFVGRDGAQPEIWTYGNRNIQGMALHPVTGALWATEHGPRGGDELNLILPGRNYGWPVITYGINYNGTPITDIQQQDGMEQPAHYWVPSIATSGTTIYSGARFPRWQGDFFVGGMAGQQLARVRLDNANAVVETEKLLEGIGRIRDVRTGPDGFLYVLIDGASAPLLRIEPAS
jgi:glucose/arabinose dehydrogenase